MAEPLLSLDTLVERDHVRIVSKLHPDGKSYELLNPDELGLVEHTRIRHRYRRLADLNAKDEITEEDAEQLTRAATDLVTTICPDVEEDVLADLHDGKKVSILEAWLRRHDLFGAGAAEGPPPTGGS